MGRAVAGAVGAGGVVGVVGAVGGGIEAGVAAAGVEGGGVEAVGVGDGARGGKEAGGGVGAVGTMAGVGVEVEDEGVDVACGEVEREGGNGHPRGCQQ